MQKEEYSEISKKIEDTFRGAKEVVDYQCTFSVTPKFRASSPPENWRKEASTEVVSAAGFAH